jgi:hypothetical protein
MKNQFATIVAVALALLGAGTARAGWNIEIVDAEGDVGQYASLAFDHQGSPCVSYHDETNGTLKIACKAGQAWVAEIVPDPEAPVGDYSSLAIEADGTVHVAYRRGSYVYSVLKYARRTGSQWQIDTVDSQASGVGHLVSLALDSSGAPHIAHAKRWGKMTVKYAVGSGSSWDPQTVTRQGAAAISLALDDSQSPRIVFQVPLGLIHLARMTGNGKWKLDTLGPGCGSEGVGLTIQGEIHHVVYGDEVCDLRYATWSENGGWAVEETPIELAVDAADSSLAMGENGDLHLSYYHGTQGALKYAHKPAGGAWGPPEVVDASFEQVGLDNAIALDSAGNPHISYYDGTNGDLRYATYSSTCTANADCDDLNDCTDDVCDLGVCINTPVTDEVICGLGAGVCCGGSCVTPQCSADADCDDGNECTTDICYDAGTCAAACESAADICDCDLYRDRKSCNTDPNCKWSNQSKYCAPL